MRLSLWYIGCTAVHNLAEDEVYVIRPNEYVTRYVQCRGPRASQFVLCGEVVLSKSISTIGNFVFGDIISDRFFRRVLIGGYTVD